MNDLHAILLVLQSANFWIGVAAGIVVMAIVAFLAVVWAIEPKET